MLRTRIGVVAVTALIGVGLMPAVASAAIPENTFVSIGANGAMPNGRADRPQISGDGRYVTFDSAATNLDPRDTSKDIDVYRRDLRTGTTELVSVGTTACPEGTTGQLAICNTYSWPSDDGRFVAFTSDKGITTATVPGRRVYVRDMVAGTSEMVSVTSDERPANGASGRPMISSTGRFVAFTSKASNLSPLGGNGTDLVYLRDRELGTTTLVSTDYDGGLPNGVTETGDANESYRGIVSSDGNVVVYASRAADIVRGDTNNREDIFVKNMRTGVTERVSVRANGTQAVGGGARPYLSSDGRYVLFNTYDPIVPADTNGKSDVYMVDLSVTPRKITWVSEGKTGTVNPGDSLRGFVSDDGRYAVFNSYANNLVDRDFNGGRGDAFVRDLVAGKTYLLSLSASGGGADGPSFRPVINADGNVVTFLSLARNLVAGDTSSGYQTYAVSTASVMSAPDTVKPTVAIGSPKGGATLSNPVAFSGTVSDDKGVRSVDVGIRRGTSTTGFEWLQSDGTTWGTSAATAYREAASVDAAGNWSATLKVSLPDGSYNSQVRAYDTAGNLAAAWVGYKVVTASTDTSAPTVTVSSPTRGSTVSNPVAFSGTVGDDKGVRSVDVGIRRGDSTTGFEWLQSNGTSWGSANTAYREAATVDAAGNWSATLKVSLPDGSYSSQVRAYDTAGNLAAAWVGYKVAATAGGGSTDTTAPTVTFSSPTAKSTVSSPVTFSGSAGDDAGVKSVHFYVKDTVTKEYLQADGTWATTYYRFAADLVSPNGTSTGWSKQLTLPAGKYATQAVATDTSGNKSTLTAWFSFSVAGS